MIDKMDKDMFKFNLQCFANATESDPHDVMMGAGRLFFRRIVDGVYGTGVLHFMGNATEMSVTTDVTTNELNSSMTSERETIASVNTKTKVTFNTSLSEYDATNLALGLFGEEGIYTQVAGSITKQFTAKPDTIIELKDSLGNPYHNITGIVVKNSVATPATIGTAVEATALGSTGTVTSSGAYIGSTAKTYNARVKVAPTAAGDLNGLEVEYATDVLGSWTSAGVVSATAITHAFTLAEGVIVTFAVTTGQNFIFEEEYTIDVTPSSDTPYVVDTDYIVDELDVRAGMIRIPESTTIPADTVIEINFTVPAGIYPTISGGNAGEIEGYVRFIGDPNVGPCYNGEFWRVKLIPDGDTSGFIGSDYGSYKLKGTVIADKKHHKDFPYYRKVKVDSK